MLERALFRKHTLLILYMANRFYFSQKELIRWCLEHHEFRDKDSIENKGQYRDKLLSYGILKKYSYRDFKRSFPDEVESACSAYEDIQERKRCILEFDSSMLIALDYPKLRHIRLPFQEFVKKIDIGTVTHDISSIVKAFVFGCSIQRILLINERLSRELSALAQSKPEISEEFMPLVENARDVMEERIKHSIEKA